MCKIRAIDIGEQIWIVNNGDIKAKSKILTTLTNSDKLITNVCCLEHEYIVYCASLKLCVYGKTFEMWNMEVSLKILTNV